MGRKGLPVHSLGAEIPVEVAGPDSIAGLTVWALIVPESMAYASIAGVPVQFGLYSVPLPF